MIIMTNKQLEARIKYLEQLTKDATDLIKTIQTYKNNGAICFLENLDEVVTQALADIVDEDKTVVLFSKDGKRIEISQRQPTNLQRKVLF